jgi:hypothetical protein
MAFPVDQTKRDLLKDYLQEAFKHTNEKDLADQRLKSVFESIKESEDSTGFTLPEFKEALAALIDYDKIQSVVDKKTAALEVVDLLQL